MKNRKGNENMDRAKIAYDLHRGGANCAQSLVCAFSEVTGLDQETTMKHCGAVGGGFRTGGICGAVSGAGVVLGFVYPHADPADMPAKTRISKKIMEFEKRFQERFPGLCCREIRDLPADPTVSPAAQRLGVTKACDVYIVSAVEILEEMIQEEQA